MIENVRYINHLGETLEFGQNGIFINENDLHDYSWSYTTENKRITSFEKGVVKKTLPIIICCDNESDGIALKNNLMECAEKDILAKEYGKIIIGNYYMKCYITGSSKGDYLINKGYLTAKLTLVTDFPQWILESLNEYDINGQEFTTQKRNFDFNYDFNYDYASDLGNRRLYNNSFSESDFKMVIHGAVINPTVYISGHTYQVDVTLLENETLTIDSIDKTITVTRYNGTIENYFNNRNRDSYIFEKIPAGTNLVVWNNTFKLDITLYDERSEPLWT